MLDLGKEGAAYDLGKETGAVVRRIAVTAKWPKKPNFDADVVAFGLGDDGKVPGGNEAYFVKAFGKGGKPESPDSAIKQVTGDAQGDQDENVETVHVDVDKFGAGVTQTDVALTIYKAASRGQNFGMFGKLKLEIVNLDTNEVIGTGNLSLEHSTHTAAKVLGIIKDGDKVYVQTNIEGTTGGLAGLVQTRGINIGENAYDN